MTTLTKAIEGTIWEDGDATMMARIYGPDAALVTQASLLSVSYKVFDVSGETRDAVVKEGDLVVADVVFDSLQTDARWTKDSTGYNFLCTLGASIFAIGDHRYRVEFRFTVAGSIGEVFWAVFELLAKNIRTS